MPHVARLAHHAPPGCELEQDAVGILEVERPDEDARVQFGSDAELAIVVVDARALFDAIGAADKRLEFIKADHYLLEPEGSRTQAADLIAAWVADKS
jgi:hypothetical protein